MPPVNSAKPVHNRLPGLDALRGIAAACVMVMHLSAMYTGFVQRLAPAYLAVDFFFLLSGFVMARTYEQRLRAGRIDPLTFLAMRYRRLWPVMLIGAVLSLPFVLRDSESWEVAATVSLPNLFLLPTFAAPEIFRLNVPAWSIFFELLANLLHALVIQRLGNWALAVVVALSAGALGLAAWHFGTLDLGARNDTMVGGLVRVCFAYGLGVLLWRLHGDRAPIPVPPLLALLAMPVLFAAATRWSFTGWRLDFAFVVIGCPLILWGGLRMRGFERIASAAGALSFPLYAVHYPLLLGSEALGLVPGAGLAVAVAGAAVVAWAFTGGLRSQPVTSGTASSQQNV